MTQTIRVVVELSVEMSQELVFLSREKSVDFSEVVSQALALKSYIHRECLKGGRVQIKKPDGTYEVTFPRG